MNARTTAELETELGAANDMIAGLRELLAGVCAAAAAVPAAADCESDWKELLRARRVLSCIEETTNPGLMDMSDALNASTARGLAALLRERAGEPLGYEPCRPPSASDSRVA